MESLWEHVLAEGGRRREKRLMQRGAVECLGACVRVRVGCVMSCLPRTNVLNTTALIREIQCNRHNCIHYLWYPLAALFAKKTNCSAEDGRRLSKLSYTIGLGSAAGYETTNRTGWFCGTTTRASSIAKHHSEKSAGFAENTGGSFPFHGLLSKNLPSLLLRSPNHLTFEILFTINRPDVKTPATNRRRKIKNAIATIHLLPV